MNTWLDRPRLSYLRENHCPCSNIKQHTCYKLAVAYFREVFFAYYLVKIWSLVDKSVDHEQVCCYGTHLLDFKWRILLKMAVATVVATNNFLTIFPCTDREILPQILHAHFLSSPLEIS